MSYRKGILFSMIVDCKAKMGDVGGVNGGDGSSINRFEIGQSFRGVRGRMYWRANVSSINQNPEAPVATCA